MSSRRYVSEQRAVAAQETRGRILAAAHQELREVGYHAMTIASLARRAEVSPQTIYNALGSKAAVIKALYDVLLAGDDQPVPMSQRPEFIQLLQLPDPISTMRAYITIGGRIYSRIGELLGILLVDGPGSDAGLRTFVSTIERERRTGNESILRHIETTFGLPDRLSFDRAADVLWAATSFELAHRLIVRCGWSLDRFEAWTADVVVMSIWGPAAVTG